LFFKNFELKYRAEKLSINIITVKITADAYARFWTSSTGLPSWKKIDRGNVAAG
jgi:hypothetical protein